MYCHRVHTSLLQYTLHLQPTIYSEQSTVYNIQGLQDLQTLQIVQSLQESTPSTQSPWLYTLHIFFLFSIHILYCLYESTHSTKSTHSKKATFSPLLVAFKTPHPVHLFELLALSTWTFHDFVLCVNIHSSIHHPSLNKYFYYSCQHICIFPGLHWFKRREMNNIELRRVKPIQVFIRKTDIAD